MLRTQAILDFARRAEVTAAAGYLYRSVLSSHIYKHLKYDLAGYTGPSRIFASIEDLQTRFTEQDHPQSQAFLDRQTLFIAKALVKEIKVHWRYIDGLPANPHMFEYENVIIDHFADAKRLFPDGIENAAEVCLREDEGENLKTRSSPRESMTDGLRAALKNGRGY